MNCHQARRLLSARREWTRGEQALVEAHLATCPACQAVAHDYEQMDRHLRRLPVPGPALASPAVTWAGIQKRRTTAAPPTPWQRRLAEAGVVLAVLAFLVALGLVLSTGDTSPGQVSGVIQSRATPSNLHLGTVRPTVPAVQDGRINILLAGIDRREGTGGETRTDTIVVVAVDPVNETVGMLSIPRDLLISIPGHGEDRINTANVWGTVQRYPGGGPGLLQQTIEANFSIPIDYYVMIDFQGFVRLVDALGGIDLDVPKTLHDTQYPDTKPGDPNAYTTVHFDPGRQHLDGEQALVYVRSRMSTDDRDRMARQQLVLLAIAEKALSLNVVPRLPELLASLEDNVQTDLTMDTMVELAALLPRIDLAQVKQVVLSDPAVYAYHRENGAAVLLPRWDLIRPLVGELFATPPTALQIDHPQVIQQAGSPPTLVAPPTATTFPPPPTATAPALDLSHLEVATREQAIERALVYDSYWTIREQPLTKETIAAHPEMLVVEEYATRRQADQVYGTGIVNEPVSPPVWVVIIKGPVSVRIMGLAGVDGPDETDGVTYVICQVDGSLLELNSGIARKQGTASASASALQVYGIQAHLLDQDPAPIVSAVQELSWGWIKQQVQWKQFEPARGDYDWQSLDAMVDAADAAGLDLLWTVVLAPDWARSGQDLSVGGPPNDPQDLATFLGAVAGRYCARSGGGGLKAIEVWDEQNWHQKWGNMSIDPAAYMELLRAAYASIKAACPAMTVVSGGLITTGAPPPQARDTVEYLKEMYQNGLLENCDAVGLHLPTFNLPPDADWRTYDDPSATWRSPFEHRDRYWSFQGTAQAIHQVMEAQGDTRPVWVTEFGWPVSDDPPQGWEYAADNTLPEQAGFTIRAFQMARDWGWVQAMFLFNLNFSVTAGPDAPQAMWSLVGPDWQRTETFQALAAMDK